MRGAVLALALTCAGPSLAQDLSLQSPIDCDLETTCFIQQYVDRDPGPGAQDFHCSTLSYDGHKGTDFALPSLAMMAQGVPVIASADGVVGGTRDGMPDEGITDSNAAALKGRECGNGVRIDHPNGWSTQYCHLKMGSIRVKKGQKVSTGTPLGEVGQSGRAAFPHVHLSVRKDGKTIDPFDPDGQLSCNTPGDSNLWGERPDYRPGGLIDIGFSDHIPQYATIKAGSADLDTLNTTSPALVIWGYSFGTRAGDILRLSLTGPSGTVVEKDIKMEKQQAQAFRAIGKKRRNTPWPAGEYSGTVTLIRSGTPLDTRQITIQLR